MIVLNKKLKGFTIIELIVVIAIIAVLAGIVLVNVQGYIKKSKNASMQANFDTFQKSASVWLDEHGNFDNMCIAAQNPVYNSIYNAVNSDFSLICNASLYPSCGAGKWRLYTMGGNGLIPWCVDYQGKKTSTSGDACDCV